jgi:hypothetical protein
MRVEVARGATFFLLSAIPSYKNERYFFMMWKLISRGVVCLIFASLSARLSGQGGFVNLDFELARVPDIPSGQLGGFVPASSGIPGWSAYGIYSRGEYPITEILHNTTPLEGRGIVLFGPDWIQSSRILAGRYSLELDTAGTGVTVAIGQTGQIPSDSKSLLFYASWPFPSIRVSFDGEPIEFVRLNSTPAYDEFGADIARFAGKTGELRFTSGEIGSALIDNIRFSPKAIPEPSPLILLPLGLGLLGFGRMVRRRSGS